MAARIKKDDIVVVTAGKDKGKRGRVLSISADADFVLVEGVNMVTRHLRKNPQNPSEGGRKEQEASILSAMPTEEKALRKRSGRKNHIEVSSPTAWTVR